MRNWLLPVIIRYLSLGLKEFCYYLKKPVWFQFGFGDCLLSPRVWAWDPFFTFILCLSSPIIFIILSLCAHFWDIWYCCPDLNQTLFFACWHSGRSQSPHVWELRPSKDTNGQSVIGDILMPGGGRLWVLASVTFGLLCDPDRRLSLFRTLN